MAAGGAAAGGKGAADAAAAGAAGAGAAEVAGATVLPEVVVSATPLVEGGAALGAGELAAGAAAGAGAATAFDAEGNPVSSDTGGQFASTEAGSASSVADASLADPTADIGFPADSGIQYPGGGGGGIGGDALADPTAGIGDTSALSGDGDIIDKLRAVSNSKSVKDAMDKLTKYGPLALGGAGMLNQRATADRFRQQMAQIGGPQRAIGEQLLGQFQQGKLAPGDAARIAEWEQSALAQARQYYSKAGQPKGTSANSTYSQISKQAEAMRQQALQGMLSTGLSTLNITDRYQAAALNAEMQADQQANAAGTQFLNAYGSWLRAVPQITGEKPATTTTT